jgi:hypothetical protein
MRPSSLGKGNGSHTNNSVANCLTGRPDRLPLCVQKDVHNDTDTQPLSRTRSRAITFTTPDSAEIGVKGAKADERLASADRRETSTARRGRLPPSEGDHRWRARTQCRVPRPLADDTRGNQGADPGVQHGLWSRCCRRRRGLRPRAPQRHAPIGGFRTLDPRNYGRRSRAPCPHARRRRFERKRALGCSEPYRRGHRGVLGAGLDAAALAAGRPGHGNKKSEPDRGAAGPQLRLQVVESTNVLL